MHVHVNIHTFTEVFDMCLLQVTNFWANVLSEEEKMRLVENIAGHLKDATEFIQKRAVSSIELVYM